MGERAHQRKGKGGMGFHPQHTHTKQKKRVHAHVPFPLCLFLSTPPLAPGAFCFLPPTHTHCPSHISEATQA